MSWSAQVHSFILTAENVGNHIASGLKALRDSDVLSKLTSELPILNPLVADLTNAIPQIGSAEAVLDVADWTAQHWAAVAAIGAAVDFAPADTLTFRQWQDSSDPADRQE